MTQEIKCPECGKINRSTQSIQILALIAAGKNPCLVTVCCGKWWIHSKKGVAEFKEKPQSEPMVFINEANYLEKDGLKKPMFITLPICTNCNVLMMPRDIFCRNCHPIGKLINKLFCIKQNIKFWNYYAMCHVKYWWSR